MNKPSTRIKMIANELAEHTIDYNVAKLNAIIQYLDEAADDWGEFGKSEEEKPDYDKTTRKIYEEKKV